MITDVNHIDFFLFFRDEPHVRKKYLYRLSHPLLFFCFSPFINTRSLIFFSSNTLFLFIWAVFIDLSISTFLFDNCVQTRLISIRQKELVKLYLFERNYSFHFFFLSTINQIQCKEKKNITTNTSVYIHMYEKIYDYIFGLTPSSPYIYVTTCIIYLCKKKKERNIFMWSYAVNWSLSLFQKPINLNRY